MLDSVEVIGSNIGSEHFVVYSMVTMLVLINKFIRIIYYSILCSQNCDQNKKIKYNLSIYT